ncbi:uncharacterized protein LOC131689028 [Topomyia yanbarensis]|uniref:uncharacterized protein LOC131689028 n=1 Tax=Topomyia yanbarensis TaxID=2498891 RepID=UPI00273B24FD|nr:uncharacterized protein LOC131689028 [Topomyia yanbarensis]
MILIALRSFFLVIVILGYSAGIWRLIDDYFRNEFKTFLAEEVKKNQYLLVDPAVKVKEGAEANDRTVMSEVKQSPGSVVTSNRLLDELIVSFGRMFTSRIGPLGSSSRGTHPAGTRSTDESKAKRGVKIDETVTNDGDEGDNEILQTSSSPSGDDVGDGEAKDEWINYWKRKRGMSAGGDVDSGHCEVSPSMDAGCERS